MDTKKINVVDVSCFFIFEATGDSESDHFLDTNKAAGGTTIDLDGDDVNDAESCSHDDDDDDDSSDDNFSFVNSNSNEVNGSLYDNNVQVCIDDKEEEGEEAHSYNPTWPKEPHNNGHKNSDDSSHEELLSEMEKNKLFWETCLAS